MGWKHANMRQGDRYQDAVAAWRAMEMLIDEALPVGVRALSFEDGDDLWDDIIEEVERPEGAIGSSRTQVKSTQQAIERKDFVQLLAQLPEGGLRCLILPRPVRVTNAGDLGQLSSLCKRCKGETISPSRILNYLTEEHMHWLTVMRDAMPNESDENRIAALGRLSIEFPGDTEDVVRLASMRLAFFFSDGCAAYPVLLDLLAQCGTPDHRIAASYLWRELTSRLPSVSAGEPRSARQARTQLLAGLNYSICAARPLQGLAGGQAWNAGVTTEAVRVPARSVESGTQYPPEELVKAAIDGDDHQLIGFSGPVGAGKTTLILHLIRDRVGIEQREPAQAVPVLLRPHPSNAEFVAYDAFIDRDLQDRVLSAPHLKKLVFIDALDEAKATRQDGLRDAIRRMLARPDIVACVIAARSWVFTGWPAVRKFDLVDWSTEEAQQFLDAWSRFDAGAVAIVRKCVHAPDLLVNPLTATFLVVVAREEPDALESRYKLFNAVTARLFLDWIQVRGEGGSSSFWEDARSGLEDLARCALQREDGAVSVAEISTVLTPVVGPVVARRAIELSERMLGLLVPDGDGKYRFVYRWIAEYLVGDCAGRENGPDVISSEAVQGVEIARHAVGSIVHHHGIDVAIWGLQQTLSELNSSPGMRGIGLETVIVASRVALDLGEAVAGIAPLIAEVLFQRLVDESSTWVSEEVAPLVMEHAARGGPVWSQLRVKLECHIEDTRRAAAAWLSAHPPTDPDEAVALLLHRDPSVRAVAIDFIGYLLRPEEAESLLVSMLSDQGWQMGVDAPAYRAARVLRPRLVSRQSNEEPIPYIRQILASRQQIPSMAAAVALPPAIDTKEQVAALAQAYGMFGDVEDVIAELEDTDGGRALFADAWPNGRKSGYWAYPTTPDTSGKDFMPLTARNRRLVLQAVRPAFSARSQDDDRRLIDRLVANPPWGQDELEAICEAGIARPDIAVQVLSAPVRPYLLFSDVAAQALGVSARSSRLVRDALLERWSREAKVDMRVYGTFPGAALVPLVEDGDQDAEDVYIAWLPMSYSGIFGREAPPNRRLLLAPRISRVARIAAEDIWAWGKPHTNAQGKPERGHPLTVGAGLVHWWPAWRETHVLEELWKWLEDSEPEKIQAAIQALLAGPLPSPYSALLPNALRSALLRLMAVNDLLAMGALTSSLIRIAETGRVVGLGDLLLALAESPVADIRLSATAAAVLDAEQSEARRLAAAAAECWPGTFFIRESLDRILPNLIQLAPEAWLNRAKALVDRAGPWAVDSVEQLVRLGPPSIISALGPTISRLVEICPPVPWLNRQSNLMELARPADVAQRLAYSYGGRHGRLLDR